MISAVSLLCCTWHGRREPRGDRSGGRPVGAASAGVRPPPHPGEEAHEPLETRVAAARVVHTAARVPARLVVAMAPTAAVALWVALVGGRHRGWVPTQRGHAVVQERDVADKDRMPGVADSDRREPGFEDREPVQLPGQHDLLGLHGDAYLEASDDIALGDRPGLVSACVGWSVAVDLRMRLRAP